MTWNGFKKKVEKELDAKRVSYDEELESINYLGNRERLIVGHDIFYGIYIN